jgi:NACHT domain
LGSAWFISLRRYRIAGILDVILHRYLVADMALENFPSLDPAIVTALVTGMSKSIGKVAAESGLKLFGENGKKLLDGAKNLTQEAIDLLIPIAQKYFENYVNRHGQFKILGMDKPLSIESVYTQVNFHPDAIQAHQSLDDHLKAFQDRRSRNDDRRAGMEVANAHQYLMILGGPGTGKTTLLRKVGLEAIKRNHGEYSHSSIPVFLELRTFHWKVSENIDLEAKIAAEFQHCGLLEATELTRKLLERGELLILFDGLDEVPQEFMKQMTTAIKNLVDRYDKNRFIASCRIAAYKHFHSLSRFTDVVIADFDEVQIRSFINNWFKSHDRSAWGDQCWSELTSDSHKPTMELAKTPLLLTLICILFRSHGDVPNNRSELYGRAVSILLSEWDRSKDIVRHQLYKDLNRGAKEELLAEIAYTNFVSNNLFFQQGEISQQIKQILREMLTDEQRPDGRDVLSAIEEQHGMLVNRYGDIYSFSHLTFQEFFTAKHIFINRNLDLDVLIQQHLCDQSWHEVFLLYAGLQKADDLLKAIERQIQTYMTTQKLQNLLVWVDKVSDSTPYHFQPLGKRAVAIATATAIINAIPNANAIANAIAYANSYANSYATANAIGIDIAIAYAYAYANAYTNNAYTNTYANANAYANAKAIDYFVRYAQSSIEFGIYRGLDLQEAIDRSEQLKTEIPDDNQSQEIRQAFAQKIINTFLSAFDLTSEMVNLSTAEIQALDNYLYGHLLLVECKRAAVRTTPEVWIKIESQMLRLV